MLRGVILVCIFGVICHLCAPIAAYFQSHTTGNALYVGDRGLYPQIATVVMTFIFSAIYFYRQLSQRSWLLMHGLILITFLTYFSIQFNRLRVEQQHILSQYQELREAVLNQDFDRAYQLTSTNYQARHTVDEFKDDMSWQERSQRLEEVDTIFRVYIADENRAFIDTGPQDGYGSNSSQWYRRSVGVGVDYVKTGSDWKYDGSLMIFHIAE